MEDGLKARLRADLTAAMKARDTVTTATLRMALAAISHAEVAGAEAVQLSDDEVIGVLAKEVKKRHESIDVYSKAGREELAAAERAEAEVLGRYLPQQLSDAELAGLVADVLAGMTSPSGEAPTLKQMGLVIKAVKEAAGSRADGARVAAAVKAALG